VPDIYSIGRNLNERYLQKEGMWHIQKEGLSRILVTHQL